jgi:hypothetical protein
MSGELILVDASGDRCQIISRLRVFEDDGKVSLTLPSPAIVRNSVPSAPWHAWTSAHDAPGPPRIAARCVSLLLKSLTWRRPMKCFPQQASGGDPD